MILRNCLLTLVLALPLLAPVAQADDVAWESVYTEDGVAVSRATVEGTNLFAFKGDTVMDASQGQILSVLLDNEHRIEWVGRLYTNEVLSRKSDFDYVLYQAFDLPALFASRDYVYHGVASRDPNTGVVVLDMQSIEHPDAPETVGVRAELKNSRYVLTPLEDGTTRVEVEILTDPKGMMPTWLVNLIQKSWPVDTLNGLRGELSKEYAGVHLLPGETQAIAGAKATEAAPESSVVETDPAQLDTAEPTREEVEAEAAAE